MPTSLDAERRARHRLSRAQPAHRELFGAGVGDDVAGRTAAAAALAARAPDWIPYRTSYYRETGGSACATAIAAGNGSRASMASRSSESLAPGSLTYGELVFRAGSRDEVLFFTHVCHPSLANDKRPAWPSQPCWPVDRESGRDDLRIASSSRLERSARCAGCKRNERRLARDACADSCRHCSGDPGALTYKRSRNGRHGTDAVAAYVVSQVDPASRVCRFPLWLR